MKKITVTAQGKFNILAVLVVENVKNLRYSISPNDNLTDQPSEVVEAANLHHTPEIKAMWQANLDEKAALNAVDPQNVINAESYSYLSATDWYVTKFTETGVEIPDDIKTARAAAREAIIHD